MKDAPLIVSVAVMGISKATWLLRASLLNLLPRLYKSVMCDNSQISY